MDRWYSLATVWGGRKPVSTLINERDERGDLWQASDMNAASISQQWPQGITIEPFAQQAVEDWSRLCQNFLDWQRKEILQGEPPQDKLDQHRTALKWLLRFTRAIYLTASDPDYPDRRIADELKGRILQLEHSWRMVHEKMPQAEAELVLKEVFPE